MCFVLKYFSILINLANKEGKQSGWPQDYSINSYSNNDKTQYFKYGKINSLTYILYRYTAHIISRNTLALKICGLRPNYLCAGKHEPIFEYMSMEVG